MELIGIYIYNHERLGGKKIIILNPNYEISVQLEDNGKKIIIEFEIKEKQEKKVPENFWQTNPDKNKILNLNAVIGENGSGKTTFLHFLINTLRGKDKNQWILFFRKGEAIYYYHSLDDKQFEIRTIEDYKQISKWDLNLSTIYYSPLFTLRTPVNAEINLSTDYLLLNDGDYFGTPIENFSLRQYHKFANIDRHIMLIEFIKKEENILSEIFSPDKIANIQITINANNFDSKDFFLPWKREIYSERKKATIFLINTLAFLLSNIKETKDDFISELFALKNSLISRLDLDEISAAKEALLQKVQHKIVKLLVHLLQSAKKINYYEFEGTLNFQIPVGKVDKNLLTSIMEFVSLLPEEYKDFIDIEFPLSSGEKSMLDMFSRLFYAKKQIPQVRRTVYLFLDEAETSFHPEWQRRFIYSLVQFIQKVFSEYQVQIFLASHSPLLISDIPKQNILFLKRSNDGEIFQKADMDTIPQTFAANLNTILADGFFLGDALIGELARRKIQEQINKINQHQNPDIQIIEIIGEPTIKDLIMRFLPEETRLKSQIKLLQDKLNNIKKQKTENNQNNDTNQGGHKKS